MPLHPSGRNYLETFKEDRDAIIMAARLGYTEAYVGEHTTDLAETIPSCLMFPSTRVHATSRIKLGTGMLNPSNGRQVACAANVPMLGNLVAGRFTVGISPGGLRSDMDAFENLDRERRALLLYCMILMIAIWTGAAPYGLKGQVWNISIHRTSITEIGQASVLRTFQCPHRPTFPKSDRLLEPFSTGGAAAAARAWEPISANFLLQQ